MGETGKYQVRSSRGEGREPNTGGTGQMFTERGVATAVAARRMKERQL